MCITGACSYGTKRFVESLAELKEKYSVSEIIDLTAGEIRKREIQRVF
jgi:hypothetical protein